MAKTRALRRAEKEAAAAKALAVEATRVKRRRRRRQFWRKVTFYESRQRSSGKLARHSRGERALLIVLTLALIAVIWYFVPSVALGVALTVLLLLFLPVLVILIFDKRSA